MTFGANMGKEVRGVTEDWQFGADGATEQLHRHCNNDKKIKTKGRDTASKADTTNAVGESSKGR